LQHKKISKIYPSFLSLRPLKTLHRFIFKSYIPPFAMTFVISVFVLFMQFLWKWVDELVGKGLDWNIISELFFYAALSFIPLALPMAVLLSSLMTFGNLAEHYELAALKSAGNSLVKIMRPLILFTSVITLSAFLFSNYILPYTQLKMLSTLFDIRQQKPALNIKEGVFYNEIDGYSLRIKKIGKDGQSLSDIMIYDQTQQAGNTSLTVAQTGKMFMTPDKSSFIFELHDGEQYEDIWKQANANVTHPFKRMKFKDLLMRLDLSGFKLQRTDQDLFKDNERMLNNQQLLVAIDTMKNEVAQDKNGFYKAITNAYLVKSAKYWTIVDTVKTKVKTGFFMDELKKDERSRAYELALNNARNCKSATESKVNELDAEDHTILRFKIEYWRRYMLSVACLIMFFVGAPLGAIIRKGGMGMPVVISVVFFLLFWVLSITGEKLSKDGFLPPEIGMWMGCIFFLPIGIWLTRKATADSAMFDSDGLLVRFLRFFNYRKFIRRKKIKPEPDREHPDLLNEKDDAEKFPQ
jgi:lipopolysaccharide export system permease protein